jgi:hypothetical protein
MFKAQTIILLSFLLNFSNNLHSQNLDSLLNNKRIHNAENIGDLSLPKIDGVLDDEIWTQGAWQGDFTQQQPYGGANGSESTFVKVLYDKSNLYVAIICQDDEPEKIRDFFDRRDALSGDMTGIAIDSYHDNRTAFEFNLSAAGQKMDLKHMGDYKWDFNWDAVWDGATALNDSGWVAEMRIPFSQIRYANEEEHIWGMHVWRWIDRKKEEDQWQYIPLEAPAMVYLFGEMKGVKNIRGSRQVEFLPYALGSLEPSSDHPFGFNGGLDAKIGISSDYTLDLTMNPDFGQVEADPSVLNLSAFEVFFEEKRPFFLEGNDIFDFEIGGDIPYYSRRIGSAPQFPDKYNNRSISDIPNRTTILSAAKITGKSKNGLSVGMVNGLTAGERGIATDDLGIESEIEVAPFSNYMASRLKKEFKEGNSSIGGFFSAVNRFSDDAASVALLPAGAYTGGLDLIHHWKNRNYFVEIKSIASYMSGSSDAILLKQLSHNHRYQRPDADHLQVDSLLEKLSGHGGLIKAGKKGGKWKFSAEGQYRSPGLNLNDMGYIRQSDYVSDRLEVSYDMNEPTKHIKSYNVDLYHEARWSFGGQKNMNMLGAQFAISNLKFWTLSTIIRRDFTHVDPRELRGGPALRNDPFYLMGGTIRSNTAKNIYGSIGFYHNGSSMDHFRNDIYMASVTWLPVRRVRISVLANYSEGEHYQQYVTTVSTSNSLKSIVGNIDRKTSSLTLRGELFFTPEMSLQYYGNPYFSVGNYNSFRSVEIADSHDLDERYTPLNTVYDASENSYTYAKGAETLEFDNPDFSFMQYRSNVVFRWEYNLGSTLYLVWSHDRSDWRSDYNPISDISRDLFGLQGNNIFMMKLNFWFSL